MAFPTAERFQEELARLTATGMSKEMAMDTLVKQYSSSQADLTDVKLPVGSGGSYQETPQLDVGELINPEPTMSTINPMMRGALTDFKDKIYDPDDAVVGTVTGEPFFGGVDSIVEPSGSGFRPKAELVGNDEISILGAPPTTEPTKDVSRKSYNNRRMGAALQMMSLGLGQAQQAVGAQNPNEMLGGLTTFVGGLIHMSTPEGAEDSAWGKMGPVMAFLGTALNISGQRQSARAQMNYRSRITRGVSRALQGLDTI